MTCKTHDDAPVCCECKHFREEWRTIFGMFGKMVPLCVRPIYKNDRVYGRNKPHNNRINCYSERYPDDNESEYCGPKATFFEMRDPNQER